MATYYVRPDGNDANTGTGSASNQAWQTVSKAIGATGIGVGDTLYIAPGIYRGTFTAAFTNPASEGQRVVIAGNPTASQFAGVSAGPVVITNFVTNETITSGDVFTLNKDYVTVQDICFTGYNAGGAPFYNIWASTAVSLIMTRCLMYQPAASTEMYFAYFAAKAGGIGANISRCVFLGGGITLQGLTHSGTWNSQTTVTDSIFINQNTFIGTNNAVRLQSQTSGQHGGVKIVNCYLSASAGVVCQSEMSTTHPSLVQNCLIEAPLGISAITNNGQITQSYNVIQSSTPLSNVASSLTTTITNGFATINGSISKIQGWADYPFASALTSAQAGINGGINTNSLAADIYGTSWLTPTTPTIGASEFASYTPSSQYLPTERNASTITIAPGSTSQSIELYLGATGLAFSTSGLKAYFVRNRSTPVEITLVAATTSTWVSGGFAEISSTFTPGLYRLDIPNAAVEAGADDVTVVVRGASGTNGAVMTIKISSGGLTAAQTANAVWDEPYTSHTTANSMGARVLKTVVNNRLVNVGTSNHIEANVHAIVNSTTAASELSGATLHNGTSYISSEVLTPVSVWDEQRTSHTTPGSFGEKLQTNALADEMLARDLGSGLNVGTAEERTVRSALRALRNKVNVGSSQMVVKKEDDTTDAWTASVTTTAVSSNVSGIDPN